MSNMSYCRFRNTLQDLQDCNDHLHLEIDEDAPEYKARKQLIELCQEIAENYGEEA